jgi:hypothetical protein
MQFSISLAGANAGVSGSLSANGEFTVGTKLKFADVTIANTAAALDVDGLATARMIAVTNPDTTNDILLALDSSCATPFATIKPGGATLIDTPTLPLYAKTSAGTVIGKLGIANQAA